MFLNGFNKAITRGYRSSFVRTRTFFGGKLNVFKDQQQQYMRIQLLA